MHSALKHTIVSNLSPLGFKYTSIRVRTWRRSRYGSLKAKKLKRKQEALMPIASKCDNLVYLSLCLFLFISFTALLSLSQVSVNTYRSICSPIVFCPGHAFVNFSQYFCKLTIDSFRGVTHLTGIKLLLRGLRVPDSLAKY